MIADKIQVNKDMWCEVDRVGLESKLYAGLLPYLIVKLGVHILGDFVLDVPGLGAGVEVAASQAHGLGQQPAEQLLLPVLTMPRACHCCQVRTRNSGHQGYLM